MRNSVKEIFGIQKSRLWFVLAALLISSLTFAQAQNTIYVLPTISPDGTVIKVNGVSGAAYSTLPAAVSHATAGDIVKLLDDVTVSSQINHNGYTLDGNGYKLTTSATYGVFTHGGIIRNLTITGASRGIFASIYNASDVIQDIVIDNCTIDNVLYTFNVDGVYKCNYSLIIQNSTLNGWTSYSDCFQSVTITNSEFGAGTGSYHYSFFRPYGTTVIQETSFSDGFKVDPSVNTILYNDCEYAGEPLTSDNLDDLQSKYTVGGITYSPGYTQEDPDQNAVVVDGDFSTNSDGEITGGIYGGNLDVLNDMCADGYAGFPIPNTDPQTYLVTPIWYIHFNPVDGGGTMADQYIARDTINFKVPDCTFTHTYSFAGWYTQPYGGGSAVAVGSTMQLTSDTTLYAYWAYDYVAKIGTTTYISLQAAVDDAYANMTGDVTIELVKDVTAWTLVKQKAGLNLTIDGQDHNIYGQILIDGTGRHTGTESLTIQNINFEYDEAGFNSAVPKAFIYFPKNETGLIYSSGHNHAHNVTVKYCTFDGDNKTVTYGIFAPTGTDGVYHITFDHLTMTSVFMPTMMNATTDLTVINVKATDVEEGINIANGNGDFIITNDTISSSTYALRVRGSGTKTANLADNYFVGTNSILFGNDGTATINIASGRYDGLIAYHTGYSESNDHTTFSITGGTYNEDVTPKCATHYAAYYDQGSSNPQTWTVKKEYEVAFDANGGTGTMNNVWVGAPTSTYTYSVPGCDFTNPDGVSFLAWNTKADGSGTTLNEGDEMTISSDTTLYAQWGYTALNVTRNVGYTTLKAAVENAQDGEEIKLLKNTDENVIQIYNSLTIDGCGYTVNGMGTYNSARVFRISNSNTDITIKNLKMVGKNPTYDNSGEGNDSRGVSFDSDLNNITLLIDNCNISATSYALNVVVGCSNLNITVSNSYLKGRGAFNSYSSDSYVTFIKDTLHGVNIQDGCEEPYVLEAFSTINLDGRKLSGNYPGGAKNTFVSLENCMVYAEMQGTCDQNWIGMHYGVSSCNVIADSQTKFVNIGQLAGYPDVHIDGKEYYNEGYGNTITLFLGEGQESQRDILKNWHYNVTNNADGSNTISYTLYYETGNPSTDRDYYDFYTPYTTVDDGHELTMIGDVTLTQDINLGIDGDLKLNFDGHDIMVNGHKIILTTDNTTVTTDMRCDSLFDSSVEGKGVKVTDNGNYTFTYSTAPYRCLNVDKTTYYVYLDEALSAADAGETIRLLDDFAFTSSLTFSQNRTIDLNNHTLSSTAEYALRVSNGNVTLKNGDITSNQKYVLYCEGTAKLNVIDCDVTSTQINVIVNAGTDTINITNGSVATTTTSGYNPTIDNSATGTIIITDATITGKDWVVRNNSTGTVKLKGCTISGNNSVVRQYAAGAVYIDDCDITAATNYAVQNYYGDLYISNSEITSLGDYGVYSTGKDGNYIFVDINNCTITAKKFGVYNNTYINSNIYGNTTITLTGGTNYPHHAVYYGHYNQDGTINIGGYKDENDDWVTDGTVTITLNPQVAPGTRYDCYNCGVAAYGGTANIFGNTRITASGENVTAGVVASRNTLNVNISGGTITADNACVFADKQTNLTVSDSAVLSSPDCGIKYSYTSDTEPINIKGGTFNITGDNAYGIYSTAAGTIGQITISGGTFNLSGNNASAFYMSGMDTINVTGGTFTATGDNTTIFKGVGTGAVFTISDATLNAATMFNIGSGDNCVVNGGKFHNTGEVLLTNAGIVTLNGGIYTSEGTAHVANTGTLNVNKGWYCQNLTSSTRSTPKKYVAREGDGEINYKDETYLVPLPADSVTAAGLTGSYYQLGNIITYNSNDGGDNIIEQFKPIDEAVTLLGDTTFPNVGRLILNWNTESNGSGTAYEPGSTLAASANADLLLYAIRALAPCPSAVDYEGNRYDTMRVAGGGYHCWTTVNLRSKKYSDGRDIANWLDGATFFGVDVDRYGYFYDWYAVMDTFRNTVPNIEDSIAAGVSVQGICPTGWHLPTPAEVEELMAIYDPEQLMSDEAWISGNGTNTSGFNMLPGGFYNGELDRYERLYVSAYFWIMTPPTSVYHACEFGAACSTTELVAGKLMSGYSVRCVNN